MYFNESGGKKRCADAPAYWRLLRPSNRRRSAVVFATLHVARRLSAVGARATVAVQKTVDNEDLGADWTGEGGMIAVPVFRSSRFLRVEGALHILSVFRPDPKAFKERPQY